MVEPREESREPHAHLKRDIQAAIEESEQGVSTELDFDVLKAELLAEFDADAEHE
jgi:hypothetical protein